MNKIIYTGDQDQLFDELDGVLMTYFDSERHVKSAASNLFTKKMMEEHVPDDKHFAVHLIGLGDSAMYGFNKNGDWWNEPSLKHDAGNYGMHTFVKNGHYFREHRNRDPKLAIGSIRAAGYNPEMHRGEIIVWGDKDKAEDEYQDAKAGKQLSFSMSAKVKGDRCSCCGNFAKRSRDYCSCAKNHMTQWMPKYSKFVYVDNVEPNFFDISSVKNPADRIARHLEVMFSPSELQKAASTTFLFSDIQAEREGISFADTTQLGCYNPSYQKWLTKLAAVESYINVVRTSPGSVAKDDRYEFLKQAATYAFNESEFTEQQLAALRKVEPSVLFGYLVKRASLIPFFPFFAYSTNQTLKAASGDSAYWYAKDNLLNTLFQDTARAPADYETEQMFVPASSIKVAACPVNDADETLLKKVAQDNTIEFAKIKNRILQNCASRSGQVGTLEKSATVAPTEDQIAKAKVVAKAYAFYKIAFCEAVADTTSQESIDDAALLLINSQHNKLWP